MQRTIICQSQDDSRDIVNLHGFSNTSQQNYGACIYLRSVSKIRKYFCKVSSGKA